MSRSRGLDLISSWAVSLGAPIEGVVYPNKVADALASSVVAGTYLNIKELANKIDEIIYQSDSWKMLAEEETEEIGRLIDYLKAKELLIEAATYVGKTENRKDTNSFLIYPVPDTDYGWIAQCLDKNIIVKAGTPQEALDKLIAQAKADD